MTSRFVRSLVATVLLAQAGCSSFGEGLAVEEGPKLLLAEAVGMTSVRLRWPRPELTGLRSYRVERRTNIDGPFQELTTVPGTAGDTAVYFDTSVEPDQIYGYRVSALGNAGAGTEFTVIAGVRTPPRPGIDVQIVTQSPAPTMADPNGYQIRIEGPTGATGAMGIGDASNPFVRRFNPLQPGEYTVTLSDVAANCRVPSAADPDLYTDPVRRVTVTDVGVQTIARATFGVECRDPTRGAIETDIVVIGGATNGAPFEVVVSGLADDVTLPNDQRAYVQSRQVGEGGGRAVFNGIRPGTYDVELRNIGSRCTLTGPRQRSATIEPLDIDRLEFELDCGGSNSGEVDDPTKPFKLRNQWDNPTPAPGSKVALDVSLFLGNTPPFRVGSADGLTGYNRNVLRADSIVAVPGFSVTGNTSTPGVAAWSLYTTNPSAASGPIPLVRVWFTVIGAAGTSTRTTTTVVGIANEDGETGDGAGSYASKTQVLPEASLTVTAGSGSTGSGGSGGGGGGSTGTANQAPTAVIDGSKPLTTTAGTAITLSSAGSSDADGTIASYAWTLPGASPATANGSSVTATYAVAGNYTATLTVTDDDGATASAMRSVSISPSTPVSAPATWKSTFGSVQGTVVPMAITLDLRSDVLETPGAERLQSFRADSIKWNPAVLEYDSTRFASNLNGTASFDPVHPGRLKLQANAVGDGPGGLVPVATVYFTVKAGGPGTTTTFTKLGKVVGTPATGDFDYLPNIDVTEGTFPAAAGAPPAAAKNFSKSS